MGSGSGSGSGSVQVISALTVEHGRAVGDDLQRVGTVHAHIMPIGEPHGVVAGLRVDGHIFGERLVAAVGEAVERDAVVAILQADDNRRNLGRLERAGDAGDVDLAVDLGEARLSLPLVP